MNIVHLVPALFGESGGITGGAERYAFELARHMAASVPTTLLSFGPVAREEMMEGLRVRILPRPFHVRGQRTNPVHGGMFREILKAKVVHCHQQHILSSSLAAIVCRFTGRRVFVSDLGGGGWDISGYVSTDRWYHGHLHLSQYSRRIAGHENYNRAHVILGGVDSEKYSPGPGAKQVFEALFVGRLLAHKGIDTLIRALPLEMKLTIVGRPYDQRYASDLRELARGKAVRFCHEVNDAALVEAYRTASCIVLPSVYRDMYGNETNVPELLGQTLLEGMACGLPALCTDVASLPELVRESDTGFIVPPNDPSALAVRLGWLAAHPAEAAAMGMRGRERVRTHFSWEAVVRRCLKLYSVGSIDIN